MLGIENAQEETQRPGATPDSDSRTLNDAVPTEAEELDSSEAIKNEKRRWSPCTGWLWTKLTFISYSVRSAVQGPKYPQVKVRFSDIPPTVFQSLQVTSESASTLKLISYWSGFVWSCLLAAWFLWGLSSDAWTLMVLAWKDKWNLLGMYSILTAISCLMLFKDLKVARYFSLSISPN